MQATVDVLIPTFNRPAALAITLTGLYYQTYSNFNIIISDQGRRQPCAECEEVKAISRALKLKNHQVDIYMNLPNRGMAHQRHFLLEKAKSPYVLYLDDDLILEPFVLNTLISAIEDEACGFVGSGTIGLNYLQDEREHEQQIEFWHTRVRPEKVFPHSPAWRRHRIHSAANIYHIQRNYFIGPECPRKYKLAWASACVLYDRKKLLESGGFDFWQNVPPEHCGEDVAAQLRVMARHGGCGILPCGVYHQELLTTLPNRKFNIPEEVELYKES